MNPVKARRFAMVTVDPIAMQRHFDPETDLTLIESSTN